MRDGSPPPDVRQRSVRASHEPNEGFSIPRPGKIPLEPSCSSPTARANGSPTACAIAYPAIPGNSERAEMPADFSRCRRSSALVSRGTTVLLTATPLEPSVNGSPSASVPPIEVTRNPARCAATRSSSSDLGKKSAVPAAEIFASTSSSVSNVPSVRMLSSGTPRSGRRHRRAIRAQGPSRTIVRPWGPASHRASGWPLRNAGCAPKWGADLECSIRNH